MIKFYCDKCDKKMGVPQSYAGKRVRCPNCKEPVSVPGEEPLAEEAMEPSDELDSGHQSDVDFDSYEVDDPIDNPLEDQDALSALLGPADGAGELQSVPEPTAAASGASCPKCSAAVGAQAVICVQCGHNLNLGVNVKTVARAKATAGFAGKTVIALIGGAVVACVAGGVWGGIVIVTGYEVSWVAIGIGVVVGFAVVAMAQKQDTVVGVSAAGLSLLGLIVGKAIIFQWMLMPSNLLPEIGLDLEDPEVFAVLYVDHMIEDKLFDPGLQTRVDRVGENEDYDDDLVNEMIAAGEQHIAAMSEADHDVFIEDLGQEIVDEALSDLSYGTLLKMNFSTWDGLWFFLAISTAFRVGSGGGDD